MLLNTLKSFPFHYSNYGYTENIKPISKYYKLTQTILHFKHRIKEDKFFENHTQNLFKLLGKRQNEINKFSVEKILDLIESSKDFNFLKQFLKNMVLPETQMLKLKN